MSTEGTTVKPTTDRMPARLDLRSENIAADRREDLLRLFPEVATEGGRVDFDQLKRALGEQVDAGKERYSMTWPGKADCFKAIQMPSTGTLLPCSGESVNFEASENLIIEGDSLEVLKLLQKSYLGKVKVIYIDPPYNTGSDFIYPDDYTESLQTYLEYTGQAAAGGKKFSTNPETDGRFHSRWLSMMYPRLYLAKNLLREDGVIFISIDDGELHNLLRITQEIFGEENFIATVARASKMVSNKGTHFAPSKDYVVCFARNKSSFPMLFAPPDPSYEKGFNEADETGPFKAVGLYQSALDPMRGCTNQRYYIECPDGSLCIPPGPHFPPDNADGSQISPQNKHDKVWRWSVARYQRERDNLVFKKTGKSPLVDPDGQPSPWNVYAKQYLEDRLESGIRPRDFLDSFTNSQGTEELQDLGLGDYFPFPKPTSLIAFLLQIVKDPTATVLDFFAGSGTTAQAVLDLNEEDGGSRRFILVQLPEPTEHADFPTIADVCKERVRRVIAGLTADEGGRLALNEDRDLDRGFRVFKLSESCFTGWDAQGPENAEELEKQLELHVSHVRDGRSEDDLLFEILLKSGFPLTTSVEAVEVAGKRVFTVADGVLLLCVDRNLTLDLVREIGQQAPERVVCLDEGFAGNDQLKANAVQIFKTKGITSFKTV
jgi:adenine-specific DNA-methyltransferase